MRTEALPDGMGALTVETGREAITAIVADLDACVATAKAAGDDRTPGQIRADELVHRITLGAFGTAAAPGSPLPVTGVRALRVSLTMPLATWLRLADHPGELDGYGPIPAALARQIATDAARDHPTTTTWRCVPIDDRHRTVLGVGDTIPTPRHDPTPRQRDLVTTADPTCVWPGCSRRSTQHGVDIDHRIPYQDGGATCPCNLQALCRRHHRTEGQRPDHLRARPACPGRRRRPARHTGRSLLWTSWTGRSYGHRPEPEVEAELTAHEQAVVAAASTRRYLDTRTVWADPDDLANPANRDSDTVHDLRARLHDLVNALRPAGRADDHEQVGQSEACTATDSWHFSIDRDRRRHERQAQRRGPRTHDADEPHDHIRDLTDECPF